MGLVIKLCVNCTLDCTVVVCVTDERYLVGLVLKLCGSGTSKKDAKLVVVASVFVTLLLVKTVELAIMLFIDSVQE